MSRFDLDEATGKSVASGLAALRAGHYVFYRPHVTEGENGEAIDVMRFLTSVRPVPENGYIFDENDGQRAVVASSDMENEEWSRLVDEGEIPWTRLTHRGGDDDFVSVENLASLLLDLALIYGEEAWADIGESGG